ncbi:MAG: N-6 DNA methylase [Bacteroidetes bacterium]|nr:N-6 DNA methylase [Bacteroidota bacterium]
MSILAIKQYHTEVEKIVRFGGTKKETAIRNAFYNLLNEYAKAKGLLLIPEITIKTAKGNNVAPDGTLKDSLRQDWGYWESKDEADDINEEIRKKFAKGYPKDNILFEDSQTAILYQNGAEVQRVKMQEAENLDSLIRAFMDYERAEVTNFRKAIELFKQDVPQVTDTLRDLLIKQEKENKKFVEERDSFLQLCQESINPNVTANDVREMIIQHILTEDIFNTIFDETQFHRENNIAHQLEKVIETFFTGGVKRTALAKLKSYSQTINAAAASIADHHEKQKFLKVVYETFYKSYNPKAADRLGVVYTPNEIVKFMIESTDYLLHKHFGKYMEDKGVEILDPATGTGTFVCDIIDYIRKEKLAYKYQHEIYANEVAILPYYVSNLNIEFTYKQKMGEYAEFENLCFVDTLDNIKGLNEIVTGKYSKYQSTGNLFGNISEENSQRIKRQNERDISVIIGNPPYNANQANENDNNKNREYKIIDQRIKDTFIKASTAQKTKVYDMYARFYRWAFDRLNKNGIIAFITNRSFIDSRTFDGFRKVVASEFNHIYILDLGGDVRANPKLSGTKHNVFGIQTGVAIMFLVRKNNIIEVETEKEYKAAIREYKISESKLSALGEPVVKYGEKEFFSTDSVRIMYARRPEFETAQEKIHFLGTTKFENVDFEKIQPDKNNNWINLADNDFETLLPLCSKEVKAGKYGGAVFELFSLGVVTARDEWVYDEKESNLEKKIKFLIDVYNKDAAKHKGKEQKEIRNVINYSIKWSRAVKNDLAKGIKYKYDKKLIVESLYRPFVKRKLYFSKQLNEMQYLMPQIFPEKKSSNVLIGFLQGERQPFSTFSTNIICNYAMFSADYAQCLPLYRYGENGKRIENITDWGLEQFQRHYKNKKITKEQIFSYVYAVLHNPAYRKKYALNLKRGFPRIPFYDDFGKWSALGKKLMDLHIGYENVKPFPLKVEKLKPEGEPKAKLKADKENGEIILDEITVLSNIPKEAWEYKLGNRSALEWILDQYKEKKPSAPTIAAQFNTYKFSDYKDEVIELLKRVCTVSVETMKIVTQMQSENE